MMGEVLIPYGKSAADTATLLLAAAEETGHEVFQVRHQPEDGGFRVPEEVAKEAGLKPVDSEADDFEPQSLASAQPGGEPAPGEQADIADQSNAPQAGDQAGQPRKRAARKTTAKKTAAKKTSSKG